MTDTPLTDQELVALRTAGYEPRGGGIEAGRILVHFQKDGELLRRTRTEWRAVIAELSRPATEDEIAFGKDAWVYCSQHCRPHQTGWCTVSPRDKVGLGVKTAEEAYTKCRTWGFGLYDDTHPSS